MSTDRPLITGIELTEFEYTLDELGVDYNGFNLVYEAGGRVTRRAAVLEIHTSTGVTGEYLTAMSQVSTLPAFAEYLLGKCALERERIYQDVKRALRQMARVGMAAVDVALWDVAGKHYGAPLYELLGGHVRPLPCYASTTHGDHNGGLDCPEAYADFAVACLERGYPAFKIHGWGNSQVDLEVRTIHEVGRRVGDRMDLMLDPACELNTFADTIKVGRACDDERFLWLEDPYKDGGISQFAHRKLRQIIRTPLLLTEHVRTLEPHVDFALAEATDFMRGDVGYDGVTGVIKLAHASEGLGLDIELHGAGPAQRHVMASLRNTNYYEMGLLHPKAPGTAIPAYVDYADGFDCVDESGCVYPPTGPGLGVTIDWPFVRRHRTDHVVYGQARG